MIRPPPYASAATRFARLRPAAFAEALAPEAFAAVVAFVAAPFPFAAFATAVFDGASSQGRVRCAASRRFAVTARADSDCESGILYLMRYERGVRSCVARCRSESCLNVSPHSRHRMVFFVILPFQSASAGAAARSGAASIIATAPPSPEASAVSRPSSVACVPRSAASSASGAKLSPPT